MAVLKGTDKNVRKVAAGALGQIGDARAIEPLIAALKGADNDVREAAADALIKIGAPTVEPLIAALRSSTMKMVYVKPRLTRLDRLVMPAPSSRSSPRSRVWLEFTEGRCCCAWTDW